MKKIYFTIAGTKYHYGQKFFEPGMEVKLVKEPDNEVDAGREFTPDNSKSFNSANYT